MEMDPELKRGEGNKKGRDAAVLQQIAKLEMDPGDMEILELKRGEGNKKGRDGAVLLQIAKLERRIFPKHESLAASLDLELNKKNSGLLFALARHHQQQQDEDEICVAGYVIYSFTSSLAASIVKLAEEAPYT